MTVPENTLHLAVITASIRPGRFGPVVTEWFAGEVGRRDDMTLDVIDLAHRDAPGRTFAERVAAADAVVVVTPEYNHSFPGPLKDAIDSVGAPWRAKAVGFVCYGGMSGGLRAVEPLRVVFAELHAVTVRNTVSFHGAQARFDARGVPHDPDGVNAAADALLDQLAWWAWALRDARAARDYVA